MIKFTVLTKNNYSQEEYLHDSGREFVDQAHAYVNWTNGISMHISMSYILLYLCRLQHVSPSYRDAVGELIMSDNEVVRAAAPRKINLCREIVLKWL